MSSVSAKFVSLHQQFDTLPTDLPDFGETRSKFYAADEGVGRMNAKIPWLASQIAAAVKDGDGAALEEISKSSARTYDDVPQANQVAMELLHEVMPFTRMAETYGETKKAMCESDKVEAAAMSKKSPK